MPIPLGIVFGWFHATAEELRSCHIGLSPKSLECYYLVLYRKGLPTSDRIDTAWVFEQMLAWLKQKCSEIWNMIFFKPLALLFLWAVIPAASIVVSIASDSGPAFGEDLQGTKMCCGRWVGAGSSGAPWVTVSSSFIRLPLCGWVLVNDTDLVTPVASHPSQLRRVA